MTDSGKPRDSGTEKTLLAGEGLDATLPAASGIDNTLPSGGPAEEARTSRASIPPTPTQRYRLGAEIGRGGMGRVVEAFDTQLGRTVALKEVLPSGHSVVRRFVREIEITARLEHASIVPLYDSGTTADGRPFYVMKRVTGRPLDEEIRRAASLDDRLTLLPAMLSAIDAIAHAHRRGVIHRDLKPANILVGELGQTTVIDWGLAKVIGEADEVVSNEPHIPTAADSLHTQAGSVFGTPGFMSPEQARGEELTPTVDVYALGATLYQLLAGKPPMGGSSATEVIGKTLIHDVKPLASVVDGVPEDLIAIVDKALSFDATVRYRDAGELAADVRRFQAGQLVAAHQYTSGQRLAKFAHRHRTVLGVVAVAIGVLVVLATFSVRRVITERDAATRARQQALVEKHAAEEARDRLAERNDALTITRARALLATNPTQALATVAEVSASSPRYGEARAVAQAAVVRGVWWGMPGPDELTTRAELSADGSSLLQLTRDYTVHVWDLERRRLSLARAYGSFVQAEWAGARVIVFGKDGPPELLDPAANRSTPLPGTPITHVDVPSAGDVALALESSGAAVVIDLATGARSPRWPGHVVTHGRFATDGSWMILRDKQETAVLDRAGTVLSTRINDDDYYIIMSQTRRAALAGQSSIVEVTLDPHPVWKSVAVPPDVKRVLPVGYRGEQLDVIANLREVHTTTPQGLVATGFTIDSPSFPTYAAGTNMVMIPTARGLFFHGEFGTVTLPIPVALGSPRYVGRAGVSRVAVMGRGAIIVSDLSPVIPRVVYLGRISELIPVDATTALGWHSADGLAWLDLSTLKRLKIEMPDYGQRIAFDELGGRAAYVVRYVDGNGVFIVRRDQITASTLVKGKDPWVIFLPGDVIAFGTASSGGSVTALLPDGTTKTMGELGAEVLQLGMIGRDVVLLGVDGRLVRFNLERGIVDQTTIQTAERVVMASDQQTRVVIALENRLLQWTNGAVTDVARLAKPIVHVSVRGGSALVFTEDNVVYDVPLVENATPKLLATSGMAPAIDVSVTRIAAPGAQLHETTIIDIETKAAWTLPPITYRAPAMEHRMLAGGSHYMEMLGQYMTIRELPTVDGDLASWAREHTSAKLVDDTLVWPWQ